MNIEVVRNVAKSLGLHPGKLTKAGIIKMIQVKEGNFDCYGTAHNGICDQMNCLWRIDCLAVAKRGATS